MSGFGLADQSMVKCPLRADIVEKVAVAINLKS
jgi:hypothetical protein